MQPNKILLTFENLMQISNKKDKLNFMEFEFFLWQEMLILQVLRFYLTRFEFKFMWFFYFVNGMDHKIAFQVWSELSLSSFKWFLEFFFWIFRFDFSKEEVCCAGKLNWKCNQRTLFWFISPKTVIPNWSLKLSWKCFKKQFQ